MALSIYVIYMWHKTRTTFSQTLNLYYKLRTYKFLILYLAIILHNWNKEHLNYVTDTNDNYFYFLNVIITAIFVSTFYTTMPNTIWVLPSWQCEVSISVQSISRLHSIRSSDPCDSWILCLQDIQSELTYKIECLEIIFSRFIVCTRSIDFWQTVQFWKTN